MSCMRTATVSPSGLADWLIARGRHFVTTDEVAELVGVEPSVVPVSLQRPRDARKIVSVTKGGWVPVPPEYREAGAPPALHFIDPLMCHLGHPYYVGFLSAARLYGASHQVPMVLQVATPALLRDRRVGESRLEFIRRSAAAERPVEVRNVPTGRVSVAAPEVVVLDLVDAPEVGGGLGNVATVMGELIREGLLDGQAIATAAVTYSTAVIQRVGYLLEWVAGEVGESVDLGPIESLVSAAGYTPLAPRSEFVGSRDRRWHVVVNTTVEHEL